ncbi:MAG: 50S ribosomal protein L33 [Patescibacteria group bacterium]|nr:50S ribosomal protein L33 [Patescibacteria group bacterium]
MAKKDVVMKILLVCTVCDSRNYLTTRNKLNTTEKLGLKKYCKKCRKHTQHKETDKLK